jgi:hypothetical protein
MLQGKRLTDAERAELQRRLETGETFARAASAVGCSTKSIQQLLGGGGVPKRRTKPRALLRLSLAEREEIFRGVRAAESCRAIAARQRERNTRRLANPKITLRAKKRIRTEPAALA